MIAASLLVLLVQGPLAAGEGDTPPPTAAAATAPTAAQRAQAMIEEERHLIATTQRRRADCPVDPLTNTIVVCAPDDSARYRLPPSGGDPDPRSTRGKGLTPPNVSGAPNCSMICLKGGHVPPPVYYLDTTTLPEAPPGSDADKIAKGEMRAP